MSIVSGIGSTSRKMPMSNDITTNDVGSDIEDLIAAIDATIKPFSDGDLVSGTIVKIDKEEVLVDIGYKSEGVIPARGALAAPRRRPVRDRHARVSRSRLWFSRRRTRRAV